MRPYVSVLTCSTKRREAMALCRRYVARQSYRDFEHVVQEGGDFWENMRDGLARCQGEVVVICEDDDHYPAHWVDACVKGLRDADLFGQKRIFNYHVVSRGFDNGDALRGNCPMHATAFRATLIPKVLGLFPKVTRVPWGAVKPRLDVDLWALNVRKQTSLMLHVVSMKGMPGRPGYSSAHLPFAYERYDRDGSVLRRLIGEDAAEYEGFVGRWNVRALRGHHVQP